MSWFRNWFRKSSRPVRPCVGVTRRPARAQLTVEALEERQVPTVTYHGGAVLQNVEAQAVFLGSDWAASATYSAQKGQLDNYLHYLVQSGYTSQMLANAY